jgi:hypothetical protein
MKNFCIAVLLTLSLALFANAQEAPPPLSNDSSLAITPSDSSSAIASPIAYKAENKAEQKIIEEYKMSKTRDENNPEDYQKNLRVVAYLHPLPLFFGAAYDMFMLGSTIEVPMSLKNSVVIQPTIWAGSSGGYIPVPVNDDRVEYKKLKRIGSGVGMRRYVVEKGQGFYLQGIAGAYYIHADSISHKKDEYEDDYWYSAPKVTTWTGVKGVIGELMFYVGAAHKWQNISFSYEGGLGFGYDGTNTFQMGYINSLVTNFNLCVGIPF